MLSTIVPHGGPPSGPLDVHLEGAQFEHLAFQIALHPTSSLCNVSNNRTGLACWTSD